MPTASPSATCTSRTSSTSTTIEFDAPTAREADPRLVSIYDGTDLEDALALDAPLGTHVAGFDDDGATTGVSVPRGHHRGAHRRGAGRDAAAGRERRRHPAVRRSARLGCGPWSACGRKAGRVGSSGGGRREADDKYSRGVLGDPVTGSFGPRSAPRRGLGVEAAWRAAASGWSVISGTARADVLVLRRRARRR